MEVLILLTNRRMNYYGLLLLDVAFTAKVPCLRERWGGIKERQSDRLIIFIVCLSIYLIFLEHLIALILFWKYLRFDS